MDKSWIDIENRQCPEYINGVNQFLQFAFAHASRVDKIRCPCYKCCNAIFQTRESVYGHLIMHGILKDYKWWFCHGEEIIAENGESTEKSNEEEEEEEEERHDDMHELIHDLVQMDNANDDCVDTNHEEPNEAAKIFYNLLMDAETELYPGCKEFSKLEFIVNLLQLKCLNGWSDKSFTALLQLLKKAFPVGESLPKSYYEAKKYTRDLGLEYVKIDACKNDCILYWKEYENYESCPNCEVSRWKYNDSKEKSNEVSESKYVEMLNPSIGRVDSDAESKYVEMQTLHETQIREKGEDVLTTREAYTLVLKHRSGYVRGMGPGPEPLERGGVREQRLREQIREDIEAEMTVRIQAEVEARMAEKEAEVQARIAQREADAETRLAQREARLEHMESQMQVMMQHLAQIGMPILIQSTSTQK